MVELLQNQFVPTDETGVNPVTTLNGKILTWEYQPPNPPDKAIDNFVVAKVPGIPEQYILGPKNSARLVAKAFNLLDSFYCNVRTMSIIINPYIGASETESINGVGSEYITECGKRFGMDQKINGTVFDPCLTTIGVRPDVRQPIFVSEDILKWNGWKEFMDNDLATIFYAGRLWHEWAHVEQIRRGLLVNSLWSERCAMTLEAYLLVNILNHNHLKERQQWILVHHISELSKRIYDYRNGMNFHDHLTSLQAVEDGTPQDQSLRDMDFVFGQ